jgi:hypothetical protein
MSPTLHKLQPVEEHLVHTIIALADAVRDDPVLARTTEARRLAGLLTTAQRQLGELGHSLRQKKVESGPPTSEGLTDQTHA